MISRHLVVPLTHSSCQLTCKKIIKKLLLPTHLFLKKRTITNFLTCPTFHIIFWQFAYCTRNRRVQAQNTVGLYGLATSGPLLPLIKNMGQFGQTWSQAKKAWPVTGKISRTRSDQWKRKYICCHTAWGAKAGMWFRPYLEPVRLSCLMWLFCIFYV